MFPLSYFIVFYGFFVAALSTLNNAFITFPEIIFKQNKKTLEDLENSVRIPKLYVYEQT